MDGAYILTVRLLYKSLSKMEEIKTAKHATSSVRTRYKYVLYTERGSNSPTSAATPAGVSEKGEGDDDQGVSR